MAEKGFFLRHPIGKLLQVGALVLKSMAFTEANRRLPKEYKKKFEFDQLCTMIQKRSEKNVKSF